MTETPSSTWTRHDLELYADDALDAATTNRLSEALRESPDLRRRLADVTRMDAIARTALLKPAPAKPPTHPRWAALLGITGAALMVIVAVAMLRTGGRAPISLPSNVAPQIAIAPDPDSMVVFSFPVHKKEPAAPVSDETAPTVAPDTLAVAPDQVSPTTPATALSRTQFGAKLDAALARGDAEEAASLLSTSDATLRADGYRRLGAVLRSVTTARRVLGELPVDAQLAACRELALEPRWRTVTSVQLTTLRNDPASREAVDALLSELARSPELAPLVERVRAPKPTSTDRSI